MDTYFWAFIMGAGGDIDTMQGFGTETETDEFGKEESGYSELDPVMDDPDHWKKYDPPVVLVFEVEQGTQLESGKYVRPVAIWQRGEKYACVKQNESGGEGE